MDKKPATDPKIDWGFYAVTPRIVRTKYKDLSHTEKWLYTCLRDLCGKKGTCFRSLRSLKEETDISIASLSAMIPRLHTAGLIHAEKKRRSASGKEIWHISIVDIWQMNKDYCSENEQSNGEDVQNLNNDPGIVHSVNNDVQNLNKTPEDCSENERDCSNFRNRRRDSKNKDTEIYNEEEGTYRASGSQGQECADAQPAHASSSDSYSLTTEDRDNGGLTHNPDLLPGDNHRDAPAVFSAEPVRVSRQQDGHTDQSGERAGSGTRTAGRGTPTGAVDTTSQQTTTTVTPAGGSGYKQDEKSAGGKRGGRKASEEKAPAPVFTAEGQKVYDAWASLFRSKPKAAAKTIECANDLYDRLVPWCKELRIPCADLLKEIKGFLFATDTNGFYKRGVTLCDVDRDFEKWQSAKTEELEKKARQAQKQASRPASTANMSHVGDHLDSSLYDGEVFILPRRPQGGLHA